MHPIPNAPSSTPLNAVGQTYHGFTITRYLPLEELQSTLVELTHEPTGARVMHIANDDPENLFCLSLQTLPSSSNGVAHILEHTVLCGSRKFPVKDPFFAMTRRSLNTFMNAMTGQDFTCYPASSQVEKDFYHLLDVYLDAVFHPELKRLSFLQEGHRLEFVDPKNPKGALQFQGVVYNEMKGAMSSIESRLSEAISKRLTPDLTYAHNSGGDPKEIPQLSYEELLEFHQLFYHPSRALFFFYGNLPLARHLNFIEAHALKGVQKIAQLSPLPPQPRFRAPLIAQDRYPIAQDESLEGKTQVAFAWLTAPIANQSEILALSLLESILTDTDASVLTLALLKSGLCTQVESSIDAEMSEIPWVIVCKGCDAESGEALKKVLFSTLQGFVDRIIPPEEIEASIHQLEFQRTEIGAEGVPFGLSLFMRAALLKQHGGDPEDALLIHSLFDELRARIKDPEYLPNLIRKYLIGNPHFLQLTLIPDPTLEKEEREEEEGRLKAIRERFTEQDERQILTQTKDLAAYQEAAEHQSLECLPKVTLRDVPHSARDFPLKEWKEKTLTIFHHECFTNQILYADLIFDLPELAAADLPLLSLFTRLLPELGSGGRSYAETLAYQQAYIGGFDASLALHLTQGDPDIARPTFSLRGKALHRNSERLFQLFVDFVSSVDLTDRVRIREWLMQHATALQNRFVKNSMNYAVQTSLSGFSKASFISDQWTGLPYYKMVLHWAQNFDEQLLENLQKIKGKILGVPHPHLVLSSDGAHFAHLQARKFYELGNRLPQRPFTPWKGAYAFSKPDSQARVIASPVAFTSYGTRTIAYRDPEAPLLLIATELLENLILHKEIREKGGAYGSGANYSPSSGNFHFYAFRDPHLARSIGAFHEAIKKIGSGNFDERELEEAKLGVIQTLDAPVPPGGRAMAAYSWLRAGRTLELREAFRKKILEASRSEVSEAVQRHIHLEKGVLVTFLGEELLKKEKKKLKISLSVVPVI